MNLSISYLTAVFGIICAKCLGFLRESVVAGKFGASSLTDIYFQVFSVANVVFTAVGVSLSVLVVKSINASKCTNERGFVKIFLKKALAYSLIAELVLAGLGKVFVTALLPGLTQNEFHTALKLYYIMLPTLLFITPAYTLNGVLQNKGRFFVTSVLSMPFNIIIIGSLLSGLKNIYAFGAVTTVGWAAQLLFLLPFYFKSVPKTSQSVSKKAVFQSLTLSELCFIIVSNLVFQLLFVMDKAFVSANAGMSSAIHYSSYLFTTVSGIFLAGMSAVFFPSLTKSISEKDENGANSLIRYTLLFMLAVFAAYLMLVGLYAKNIISLLYERGNFTAENTRVVSEYFRIYSLCIFGYITQELLFKIFYAKNRYKLTVISAVLIMASNLAADFIFKSSPFLIVVSTAVLCCVLAAAMFFVLAREHKGIFNPKFGKMSLARLASSLVFPLCYLPFYMLGFAENSGKLFFAVPAVIGSLAYLALLWKFGILKEIFLYKSAKGEQEK